MILISMYRSVSWKHKSYKESGLNWAAIGTYDPEWKSYVKGFGGFLKNLETGKGYFILMNKNGTLVIR